jgi:hypothetical protein
MSRKHDRSTATPTHKLILNLKNSFVAPCMQGNRNLASHTHIIPVQDLSKIQDGVLLFHVYYYYYYYFRVLK